MSESFDRPKVVEAEVVREHDEPTSVQHVEVEEVRPDGRVLPKDLFQANPGLRGIENKVKQVRARLWAATAVFILIAVACFVGVFMTEVVPLAALFLVLGVLFTMISAALGFVVRGMRRLSFSTSFNDLVQGDDDQS